MADLADSVARRYEVLRPHLSEFQRRLWLGAEAAELGSGGVAVVSAATGVAADTVRRGRAEADDGTAPAVGRSRRSGGGRKRAESHDEELVAAFESLIDPATRGDPMSPLRWTSKSIRTLTDGLREKGPQVSDFVVRRLFERTGVGSLVSTHSRTRPPAIALLSMKATSVGAARNRRVISRDQGCLDVPLSSGGPSLLSGPTRSDRARKALLQPRTVGESEPY